MKKTYGLIVALAVAAQACADVDGDTGNVDPQHEATELGDLSLKLTGVDTSGRDYRLRNASFTISTSYPLFPFPFPFPDAGGPAPVSKTVSSETNPDASTIAVQLVPGGYYVNLDNADWYLERRENGAWERVEQAVLLSAQNQYAYVYQNSNTPVAFRFGVDGELIDFRSGELQIGIEIEQPGDQTFPDAGIGWPEGGLPIWDASVPDAALGQL